MTLSAEGADPRTRRHSSFTSIPATTTWGERRPKEWLGSSRSTWGIGERSRCTSPGPAALDTGRGSQWEGHRWRARPAGAGIRHLRAQSPCTLAPRLGHPGVGPAAEGGHVHRDQGSCSPQQHGRAGGGGQWRQGGLGAWHAAPSPTLCTQAPPRAWRAFSMWTQNTHPPPAGKVTIHPPSISQRMKLRLSKVKQDIL